MTSPKDEIIITCAVTGNLTRPEQTPHLPITPEQIATASLEAADAGAAAVHIHVRDPLTGAPSMAIEHYREVIERIRTRNSDLIINLTTGPGGRFVPGEKDPRIAGPGTTLMLPEIRAAHIAALKPDIGTIDLNTMTFGKEIVINTPPSIRRMAAVFREAGVKPEIELFDSGDIALLCDLVADGTFKGPILCAFILAVKYGFQPTPETVIYARNLLPPGCTWSAVGTGRFMFPYVAQAYLAGGNVRVGLEDGIYIEKGVLARSNAEMVEKARKIVELLGGRVATAKRARELMGLKV